MNNILCLVFVLAACSSLFSQPGNCDCFDTRIINAQDTLVNCRYYEFEISHDGNCKSALSNFTMAIECGSVADVWNSLGSPVEANFTDPNNGLWGYKVDNIQDFGEGSVPDTFTVGFTFCPYDDYCADDQSYWKPIVAYKAGQCLIYDTLDISTLPGLRPKAVLGPNPTTGPVNITFTMPGPGEAKMEVLDFYGNRMAIPLQGNFTRQQRLHRNIDLSALPPGMYLYLITTPYGRSSGRIYKAE